MDFHFTPEQETFRKELKEFIKKELPADWDGGEEGTASEAGGHKFNRAMSKKLAEKGWLTLAWPKEHGGQARPHMEQLVYKEEVAYNQVPGTDGGTGGISWVGPVLMIHGTGEQKKHLPTIAAGDEYWCTLYSEPGAGSDLAALETRAVLDGDDYVVNGSKIWTSGGHYADWGWLAARTNPDAPKHKGVSIFLMDMKSPGITHRPIVNMAGAHNFNQFFFDDVRIPKANLVGEENQGWYILATALDFERSGVAYSAGGRRMLERLSSYVGKDGPGGQDLASNSILRNKFGEMAVEVGVAKWLSYRVAWMQSQGQIPNQEASISKLFGTELSKRINGFGMEVMGMYGQLEPGSKWAQLKGKVERGYLSSVSATIAAGTSEIQRNIIATRGLGLPR